MDKHEKKQLAHGIADASPTQLAARMEQIARHLAALDDLLADARGLENQDRRTALRLRGEEEVAALRGVIQFASLRTELFGALAAEDDGEDPGTFETELLANRLATAQALGALAEQIDALHQKVADAALYTVSLVKPAVLAAYEIAKPYRKRDPHGALLFPAVNFYRGAAAKGAKTQAAHRAQAAAQAAGGGTGTPQK